MPQPGLRIAGNIDLSVRPRVRNADGTVSTIRSISIGTDRGEVLIPTVIDGRVVSNDDAIAHFKRTGQHLGIFDTSANATAFAQQLHEREASGQGSQAPGMAKKKYRITTDKGTYEIEVEEPASASSADAGYVRFNQLSDDEKSRRGMVGPDKPSLSMWIDQQAGQLAQNPLLQSAANPQTPGDFLSLALPSGAVPVGKMIGPVANLPFEIAANARRAIVGNFKNLLTSAARGVSGTVSPEVLGMVSPRAANAMRLADQVAAAVPETRAAVAAPSPAALAPPPPVAAASRPPIPDVPAAPPMRPPQAPPQALPAQPPVPVLSQAELEAQRLERAGADATMLTRFQDQIRAERAAAQAAASAAPTASPRAPRTRRVVRPQTPAATPPAASTAASSLEELRLTDSELTEAVKWHDKGVPPEVILQRILNSRRLTAATGTHTPEAAASAVRQRNASGRWPE